MPVRVWGGAAAVGAIADYVRGCVRGRGGFLLDFKQDGKKAAFLTAMPTMLAVAPVRLAGRVILTLLPTQLCVEKRRAILAPKSLASMGESGRNVNH